MAKRVALVTGGSRGIGLGIARSLAREGYDLAIGGRRAVADVADALDSLAELGADVCYCQGDVSSAGDRQSILRQIREQFGRLNVLVNNAGIAPSTRNDILQSTEDEFERVLKTNLQGPYFLTQLVANWLIEQQSADSEFAASIVNISSVSATEASVARGEYCISKAGVSMATQLWAVRLAEYGIPVYEVRPGLILTDMTSGVKEKYDGMIEGGLVPQQRWGTPEDNGRAVAALVRGDFGFSTGQVVMVDGGMTLRRL